MNIVLLGAPASGKGTQAELIAKKLKLYHLQTGDLSRNLAKKDARIRKIVDSGELIPEEEMSMYVVDFLAKNRPSLKNILFEGFPRFIGQYKALDEYLKTKGDDIDAIINLEVSEKEAIKRISARRICTKCGKVYNLVTNPPAGPGKCACGGKLIQRKDDRPEAVKVRFKVYDEDTKKLRNYLSRRGKLIKVDGERPVEEIFTDILKKLTKVVNAKK